jgi:glycosyltransferase involved in cell wall biosynthesis
MVLENLEAREAPSSSQSASRVHELDLLIPVYNEGANIIAVLDSLRRAVSTPFRVLICYDFDEDDTLPALAKYEAPDMDIICVRNTGRGAHKAVLTGFAASTAPYVVVFPADDDYNAVILDPMVDLARSGHEIVCASRLMPGGAMVGCPWLKSVLLRSANWTLYNIARLPTHDASNGFRLFSRRVIQTIVIESTQGFTYSIELLVKCHRLGWPIGEVPARWFERIKGQSRFRVVKWLFAYLRWYFYALKTTYLRASPSTVPLKARP